jgi:GAF domain-containing protein/HAMP domain-containing protein
MSQSKPEQIHNALRQGTKGVSLQTRLALFVLFVSLVPLIIITVRNTIQTQQALTNGAETSLKSSAIQTANSLDTFIQTTLDSISAEAQLADLLNFLTITQSARTGTVVRERTLAVLENLAKKDSANIISYALVDTNGNVLLDSSTGVQYNESKEAYFTLVKNSEKPIVTAVTYSDDKTTSITFAAKILNINTGRYVGSLRVKYKSSVLQDVILESVGPSADVSVLLLDQLNIRMADSQNPELILKSIVPLDLTDYLVAVDTRRFLDIPREEQATNYTDFDLMLGNAVNQPFFRADITPDILGDDTIAVAFMQTQPWTVAYSRPTSIFLADAQKQTRANITLIIAMSIIILIIAVLVARSLTNPIIALVKITNLISQGDLKARAKITTSDEIGLLASAFNSMADQLQSTLVGLEQRVNERTADLQKSTQELETIAVVAREISIIRDIDTLLKVSVELIRERFGYYHVGIFLVDERGEFAILRAASSIAANKMLEQNYRLKVGQEGLVGKVTRTGQAHIALDVGTDATHFQNPFLPKTRSEIALPLRNRSITIGALDIQTDTQSAFSEQDIRVLQLLADQLSAAIENAQLAQQVNETLDELSNAYQLQTQNVWRSAINQYERPGYEYDGIQVRSVPQNLPESLLQQLEKGEPIITGANGDQDNSHPKTTLMVPLTVLHQVIGVIGLEQEDPGHVWTDEEISIAQAAANRAGITLENARLLKESQRRATKERAIFDATAHVGSALDIRNILHTAAEEIERILGDSEVVLQINNDNVSSTNEK